MIYDCFTFFNEFDLLEIRLNMLGPHVDFFVISESHETFSGKPKPLYFTEHSERFEKWAHKMIFVHSEPKEFPNAFERAEWQKDALRNVLEQAIKPNEDDIIYYGDLDEIWKPQNIKDDKVYSLEQLNYCYYLNNRSSEQWVGTVVGKWKTIRTRNLSCWRANHENVLLDGGWHFTNMGGADQIRKKLDAYDHQEFNHDHIKADIERRMAAGEDYVGRSHTWQGIPFKMWIEEVDLPKYLLDNKDKYKQLFK